MRHIEFVQILDGTHPTAGQGVAIAHQALIAVSAILLAVETMPALPGRLLSALALVETAVLVLFAAEYLLRLVCTPRPLHYALSFWGIVDLLSCLPLLTVLNGQWAAVRSLRLLRLVRVLKLLHANRALDRLKRAISASRGDLIVAAFMGFIVLYITAVGIYILEHEAQPDDFGSVPASLWWAVVSFTTVGYGDAYPITIAGRIFTSVVLFIGLGVIAVPTAIITSALINSDLREGFEREIEDDLRGEIDRDMRRDLSKIRRKPTRRE